MTKAKKLIEVAMPIKEISAESVRDKSIRNGHISTLHLWWARRPLPVCRAVVFASLVPDPLDENCPQQFKDAVEILLGSVKKPLHETGIPSDAFKPYDDIPYTAAIDKMVDNNRNRLMMFIGKFSKEYCANEKGGKITQPLKQINEYSLIRWENKNNEVILGKARKLIWVAHNSHLSILNKVSKQSVDELLDDFDKHYGAIKESEMELYEFNDRHIENKKSKELSEKLHNAIEAFLNKMPKVFDPFAGGGAIPLEAARLGCRSYGNDINPVAHIIQKSSLEFPQKFGKPITYSKAEFIKLYGANEFDKIPNENKLFGNGEAGSITIPNRLSFDVEFFAKKLLLQTEKEIGNLYPADENGKKPIAYYWSRIGICSNPSCKAEVPLLRQFYLSKRRGTEEKKWTYLKPIIKSNQISFDIVNGKYDEVGWMERANMKCPCCGNITDVKKLKEQFNRKQIKEKIIAVIDDSANGKVYRQPYQSELNKADELNLLKIEIPSELMPVNDSQNVKIPLWGFKKWGEMFSNRQLIFQNTLINELSKLQVSLADNESEYSKSIITYLAILVDRISVRNNTFCRWHTQQDTIEHPFSRQAIPMMFDYPEMNPFADFSGSAIGQLQSIIDVINQQGKDIFISFCNNSSSGEKNQFEKKFLDIVVTDPPYYDAIAYADLSDFFYVWLKRMLSDLYPMNFATPQTPKSEECTAIKHNHSGDANKAKNHFESKLQTIFQAIEIQTKDLVSIMFAHQSTEA